MTTHLSSTTDTTNLYDRDYYLWLQQTAQLIKFEVMKPSNLKLLLGFSVVLLILLANAECSV